MSLLLTLAVLAQAPAAKAPRTISVEDGVHLALLHSPGLHAVQLRADSAEDQSRSVRGRMLPGIYLSDEHQHYSEAFDIAFGPASFVARGQNVNTFVAAASQPVLGLLHLFQDKAGLDELALAAHEGEHITEDAITEAVQTGYLRYFEGKASEEVATASIAQLDEQRQVMEARVKAGAATTADLLRLEVAIANARQQLIVSKTQEQITYSALLIAMGFSAEDSDVTLLEPTALEDKVLPAVTEVEAQQRAAANRPEVFRARYEQRAAEHQSTSKFFLLLPEANLEAGYVHLFGQAFAPADSYYVGFKATWNIWEWGASWFQRQAAQRNAEAAADVREDQERQVKTEASSRLSTYRSAHSAVEVAQTAIASAEEAWRVTQALLKAGTATTTDLLDSQSALTQAKLNLVRARYQEAVAKVGVERAMGRPHGDVQ